jgi:hypothetical protein
MKNKRSTILKISFSLILLIFIFSRLNLPAFWKQLHLFTLPFIVFALLYYTGCQVLSCLRWQIVLRASGYDVKLTTLIGSYFAGMFANNFLPGSFGGDFYRVYQIGNKIKDTEIALASVFLERFAGLAAIFGLAIIGLPPVFHIIGKWNIVLLFVGSLLTISSVFILTISPRLLMITEHWLIKFSLSKISARLAKIQIILRKFLGHRKELSLAIGLSFIIQLSVIYYQYLLAQQLHINVSFLELLVFVPISVVVCLLPISFGGLGVQEGLWAYLFTSVGLKAEQAVLLSLSFTILGWLLSLPGAIIITLDSNKFNKSKNI